MDIWSVFSIPQREPTLIFVSKQIGDAPQMGQNYTHLISAAELMTEMNHFNFREATSSV